MAGVAGASGKAEALARAVRMALEGSAGPYHIAALRAAYARYEEDGNATAVAKEGSEDADTPPPPQGSLETSTTRPLGPATLRPNGDADATLDVPMAATVPDSPATAEQAPATRRRLDVPPTDQPVPPVLPPAGSEGWS